MAIYSENGRLRRVIVHAPGPEVEQMTPATARTLLYNDIVPIESVQREHAGLRDVLSLVAETIEVTEVLDQIAARPAGVAGLAAALAGGEPDVRDRLLRRWHGSSPGSIRNDCILGVTRDPVRVSDIYRLSPYITPPLPNGYFTRDAAFVVHRVAYRSVMAGSVRSGEAAIMAQVLGHLGLPVDEQLADHRYGRAAVARIEGGDVLVLDRDTLVIGLGERSGPEGIDALITAAAADRETPLQIIVVELPEERATIHLDMIATVIGPQEILGFRPLLEGRNARRVFTITAPPGYGSPWKIEEHADLITGLRATGYECSIVPCGDDREVVRDREQWFSACNSIAIGPRQIVVYRNNPATLDALSKAGYAVRTGDEVLHDPRLIVDEAGCLTENATAIAIDGVELARGGGGPRCMTLPVEREE